MPDEYYDRLGVSQDASQDEIEEAWTEAVKEKHPDKSDDPNAQQQFIRLKEAYDVLSDADRRERYDRLGHDRFVDDRTRTTTEASETAYERERTGTQSKESAQQQASTRGGTDWRANTRGHPAADHVWQPGSGPTADTAPPTETTDVPAWKELLAYQALAVPPNIPVISLGLLITTEGSVLPGLGHGVSPAAAILTIFLAALIGQYIVIVAVERFLDTDRRLWTPF